MDAIFNRRTIRDLKSEAISDDQLRTILKAGMAAPDAFNVNGREFIVVKSEEGRKKIAEAHIGSKTALNASAVIIVCGDTKVDKYPEVIGLNCAASIENMLICATSLGLGSSWIGTYPNQEIASYMHRMFEIPDHIMPIGMVAIGAPDNSATPHNEYHENKVHFEKY